MEPKTASKHTNPKPLVLKRAIAKGDIYYKEYQICTKDHTWQMWEEFMKLYEHDKFLYQVYCKNYYLSVCSEEIDSWSYTFTIGEVEVNGWVEGFDSSIEPEWDAAKIYDRYESLERRMPRYYDD